jgi:hypothetical protein
MSRAAKSHPRIPLGIFDSDLSVSGSRNGAVVTGAMVLIGLPLTGKGKTNLTKCCYLSEPPSAPFPDPSNRPLATPARRAPHRARHTERATRAC